MGDFGHEDALVASGMMIQVMSLRPLGNNDIRFRFVKLAVGVGNVQCQLAPDKAAAKYQEQNFKEGLKRECVRRVLSHLVDQISIDELVALSLEVPVLRKAFHL